MYAKYIKRVLDFSLALVALILLSPLLLVLTMAGAGFTIPAYFILGLFTNAKPAHHYVDRDEQKYWQRVRQSPHRTAREIRSRFRDIDRRLAEVESYYVSSNPRLSAEIERLR